MKITLDKNLSNNTYSVTVTLSDVATTDTNLLADFGEPDIDVGGDVINAVPTTLTTLATKYRKLISGYPFTKTFSLAEWTLVAGGAKAVANAWGLTQVNRITAALGTLRGNTDDFTASEETIV